MASIFPPASERAFPGIGHAVAPAGMDRREVVARFKSVRPALAVMIYPAIARVFGAGSAPQGRRFFGMIRHRHACLWIRNPVRIDP